MPKFVDNIVENAIGYIVTFVVGAVLVLLMNSGQREARLATVEKRQDEQSQILKDIEKNLAEGGPVALAQRVDALAKAIEQNNAKLDRILELVVARR